MLGPIDYIAVSFKGNNFNGSVLEALSKAADSGIIRVVDILFVMKDADGEVLMAEVTDQDEELVEMAKRLGMDDDLSLLTEEDVQKIGAKMENDTSAGLLVIEQLWAKDLKKALLDLDAELLEEGRIHPEVISAAVEELDQQKVAKSM